MTTKWGALPLNEDFVYDHKRCLNCGDWCALNYEHCDKCLLMAARAVNAVDRAVSQRRKARS